MKAKPLFLFIAVVFSLVFYASAQKIVSQPVISNKTETGGGIIRGRLVKANSKPLAFTAIELVPVEADQKSEDLRLAAITTSQGNFAFKNLPSGKYTLSINFKENPTTQSPYSTHFYPNTAIRSEAKIFTVNNTTNLSQLTFRLPQSHKIKRFTGKIVWEDGEPVANALVSLVDINAQSDTGFGNVKSNSAGVFKVTGFIGRRYQIAAILFDGDIAQDTTPQLLAQGFSRRFYLHTKTNIIKITLTRPGKSKKKADGLVGRVIGK
jgi:hypothetical protein